MKYSRGSYPPTLWLYTTTFSSFRIFRIFFCWRQVSKQSFLNCKSTSLAEFDEYFHIVVLYLQIDLNFVMILTHCVFEVFLRSKHKRTGTNHTFHWLEVEVSEIQTIFISILILSSWEFVTIS